MFGWLQRAGNLDDEEMLRTFNCGVGLILVAAASHSRRRARPRSRLRAKTPTVIGEIEPGRGVKSSAKGKGEAEAVRYSGKLEHRAMTAKKRVGILISGRGSNMMALVEAARAPGTILPKSSPSFPAAPRRLAWPGHEAKASPA